MLQEAVFFFPCKGRAVDRAADILHTTCSSKPWSLDATGGGRRTCLCHDHVALPAVTTVVVITPVLERTAQHFLRHSRARRRRRRQQRRRAACVFSACCMPFYCYSYGRRIVGDVLLTKRKPRQVDPRPRGQQDVPGNNIPVANAHRMKVRQRLEQLVGHEQKLGVTGIQSQRLRIAVRIVLLMGCWVDGLMGCWVDGLME